MSDEPKWSIRDWIGFFATGVIVSVLVLGLMALGLKIFRAHGMEWLGYASAAEPEVTEQIEPVEPVNDEQVEAKVEALSEPSEPLPYTEDELEILAVIIYQEAGADYCSDETRQMVGEVFLNRVASELYPNNFYDVATQRAQYGRLCWTGIMWPERSKYECEAHAVQRAYDMAEALLSGSVERLLPEDVIYQSEYIQGFEVAAYEDGIYFCR